MKQRVITISDRFIKNLFAGLCISFLILFIIHIFSDYSFIGKRAGVFSYSDRNIIDRYFLFCPLGMNHVFNGNNVAPTDIENGQFSITKLSTLLQASIHHWLLFVLIATVFVVILQLNIKVKLQESGRVVIKEEPKLEVRSFTRGEKYVIAAAIIFLLAVVGLISWSA